MDTPTPHHDRHDPEDGFKLAPAEHVAADTTSDTYSLAQKLAAEALGTAFLLATVVGSGIMGETLAGGNIAIALLANTIATGAILVVLITVFGSVSGAHFNPAVTLHFCLHKDLPVSHATAYIIVQIISGIAGVMAAHIMFVQPIVSDFVTPRNGLGQWTAEFIATFGLVATIIGCVRFRPDLVAFAVGLFITAAYWFTSSTSFANPAVTIARSFTGSFAGIQQTDVIMFVIMQILGALAASVVMTWLVREKN